jgi:hypothetical protein
MFSSIFEEIWQTRQTRKLEEVYPVVSIQGTEASVKSLLLNTTGHNKANSIFLLSSLESVDCQNFPRTNGW